MTPTEYADKLRLQLAELLNFNAPLFIAASTVNAQVSERIFDRGEAAGSGQIGQYNDTNYLYLNPTNAKVFGRSKIGKPGKFKNGNQKKTVKLTYKEYKAALGKPAGGAYVNLELTGDLMSDFSNLRKVSSDEYVVELNPVNFDKARGNEQRFGRQIFELSSGEELLFREILEKELAKIFQA